MAESLSEKDRVLILADALRDVRYKLVDLRLTEQERLLAADGLCLEALSTSST